jgi:hypothetical protein
MTHIKIRKKCRYCGIPFDKINDRTMHVITCYERAHEK